MSLEDAETNARRARTCRLLLDWCRMATSLPVEILSEDAIRALGPNGYQQIVLDLYLAERDGRRVYQSYLAGSGPPGRIHRQVARLEALGLVSRALDPSDLRRLDVRLTAQMSRLLDLVMDALEVSAWQHLAEGSGRRG